MDQCQRIVSRRGVSEDVWVRNVLELERLAKQLRIYAGFDEPPAPSISEIKR